MASIAQLTGMRAGHVIDEMKLERQRNLLPAPLPKSLLAARRVGVQTIHLTDDRGRGSVVTRGLVTAYWSKREKHRIAKAISDGILPVDGVLIC